jgi:hypothetical protein
MLITSFMSHVANATMLDKRRGRATQSSKADHRRSDAVLA